jgi:hypothetical protein
VVPESGAVASVVEPSGLLVSALLTSFAMLAACGLLSPNTASAAGSLMTDAELTPRDTSALSALLLRLSAITMAAPIPIPNSTEKKAIRSSRRNRGVGDKKPNSG